MVDPVEEVGAGDGRVPAAGLVTWLRVSAVTVSLGVVVVWARNGDGTEDDRDGGDRGGAE
ncbi:MAG TPA: hypothetical protein VGP96_03495 [Candidatus Dormibacteraeota bacterium]|nr:hypothetical protein [Candidatus Dormibacteraeota bacterium]